MLYITLSKKKRGSICSKIVIACLRSTTSGRKIRRKERKKSKKENRKG